MKLFNSNTGYFINCHSYWFNGMMQTGYVVCQGYKFLGINGFYRIGYFVHKTEAEEYLKTFAHLKTYL
jgi:hypothetical protein